MTRSGPLWGQPPPLTSSDIKQMLAVTLEAGWSSSLPPAIRSCAGGTDTAMEREGVGEEGRDGGVGGTWRTPAPPAV